MSRGKNEVNWYSRHFGINPGTVLNSGRQAFWNMIQTTEIENVGSWAVVYSWNWEGMVINKIYDKNKYLENEIIQSVKMKMSMS